MTVTDTCTYIVPLTVKLFMAPTCCAHVSTCVATGTSCSLVMKPFCETVFCQQVVPDYHHNDEE